MLAEFLSWWCGQLAALIAPLRGPARLPDALLLRPDPDGAISMQRRRRGQEAALVVAAPGQRPARGRRDPLVLVYGGRLLLREIAVPLAAERNLDSMLAYEIDRLTPFAAADVVWTHRVLGRDHAQGQVRVELALVPRAALASLLARLAEADLVPTMLEATGPDGTIRRLSLVPPNPARLAARRRHEGLALAACAVLAVALVGQPFLRQSLALADTEARMAALRPAVQREEALRQRILAGGAGANRLAAAREQAGTVLRALVALNELLPDDTWLTALSLRKSQISIEGHSAEATRLIATLAADPRLRNPGFIAPVVRGEDGRDIFSIRAELTP
jgi:general secretion pathway protein L